MSKIFKLAVVLLLLVSAYLLAINDTSNSGIENSGSAGNPGSTKDRLFEDPVKKGRVHTAGLLWLNVTNFGMIGTSGNSPYVFREHCSGKPALSAELPGGSGIDYLFGGGIWVGGYLDSINQSDGITMNGPFVSTSYEGWMNPPSQEMHATGYSSRPPGVMATKKDIVETSNIKGRVNCFYNPVYDSTANAHEQFTTWYTDKLTDPDFVELDDFDKLAYSRTRHLPVGVDIKQTSYAWSSKFAQKFIIVDYTIYNTNEEKNIYNFYVGMLLDNDIGKESNDWKGLDDVAGFKKSAKVKMEDTGNEVDVPLNMCWVADNDGRDPSAGGGQNAIEAIVEPMPPAKLDGATSIFTLRVLRNPNPKLRYSFNIYNAAGSNSIQNEEGTDWGPRWKDGYHDMEFIPDPDTGEPVFNVGNFKQWDLSYLQRGYSDGKAGDPWAIRVGQGGMTEGRALGDYGRYMMMANGEFDYDFTKLLDPVMYNSDPNFMIPATAKIDPSGTPKIYKQRHKFQPYTSADGTDERRVHLGNGADAKFVVSFGPLGTEEVVNLKTSSGNKQKTAYRFAAGDSIKLTLAFIVSENFHTWLGQNPKDPKLDDQVNWGDVFRNSIWADRLYDVPMTDTEVLNPSTGLKKGDGWYGEDIGKDATFGLVKGNTCWWNNSVYGGSDNGESNFVIDTFTVAAIDNSVTEDLFAKYGNGTTLGGMQPFENAKIGLSKDYGFLYEQNVADSNSTVPVYEKVRFGWNDKEISTGDGVPDFSAPEAPPSPKIKVETDGRDLTVTWRTDNFGNLDSSPEKVKDKFAHIVDFEGYQLWLSDSKNVNDFVEIFGVDRENYTFENISIPGIYLDVPFLKAVSDTNTMVPKYRINGFPVNETDPNKADSVYIQQMDSSWTLIKNFTAFAYEQKQFGNNKLITGSHSVPGLIEYSSKFLGIEAGTNIYEYKAVLKNKMYGKKQYIAVTSSDFGNPKSKVDPLKSSPAMNSTPFVPGKISGNDKVYVVPNPYRADVDYEKIGWERVVDKWREVDRKIQFINIPKHAIIRIYTLAGDLVKTISHNGDANEVNREGENVARWNLLNQNDQAVASGIYLFAVEDLDGEKDGFVGKFVIIK